MKKYASFLGALGALLTLFLVTAPTAHAQFYLGVFSGNSYTRRSDLHIFQPSRNTDATFENVGWEGRPFSGSIYYGYHFGTWFKKTPNWGVQFDFVHSKNYAKVHESIHVKGTWDGQPVDETVPMDQRVSEFRITNGTNIFSLSAMYRWMVSESDRYPQGRLQPYVGAGPSFYVLWPASTIDGEQNERRTYQTSGWGFVARGGTRYGLSPKLFLFAELRYTNGNARVDIAGEGLDRGTTHLSSWHTIGGIEYNF